ncbi:hypothetical protein BXO88_03560 [Oribacterium sp. C9]|nr:hypothetical protein BXO88_03560 [Oribacterium sp. C9]
MDKKYPYKKQINLMYHERKVRHIAFSIGLFTIYLILLFLFTKYGVYEELGKADQAERYYKEKQQELEQIQRKNDEYPDVRLEYSHYGNSYMNEQESSAQDMVTMLNIIDERIREIGAIQSVTISSNVADIRLGIEDANRLPEIIRSLEESEYINYVTAQTASTVEQNRNKSMVDADGNIIIPQYVDAAIEVHFRSPDEVTQAVASGNSEAVDAYLDASPNGEASGEHAYIPFIMEKAEETEAAAESAAAADNSKKKENGNEKSSSKSTGSKSGSSGNSSGNASASASKSNSKSSSQNSAQAAAQQQAAAQAASKQQSASAQSVTGAPGQNVIIDTPNSGGFGSGAISIQGGSPLG